MTAMGASDLAPEAELVAAVGERISKQKFSHPPWALRALPPLMAVFAAPLRLHPTIGQIGFRQIGRKHRFEVSMGTSPLGWTPGCPSALGAAQCGNERLRSEWARWPGLAVAGTAVG